METEVGRILVRILGDAAGYLKALGTASAATQAFSSTVTGLLGALGGASIMAAGQMEQLEISFRVLTGSAAMARKTIGDLVQFAVTTPFEVPQVVQAAKQMVAFGTNARDIVPTMRMLGDVSASLGTPLGDLVYLFGTLRSQGRAYMLDINQFAMRGIPIWENLAKVLGVTKAEVRGLVTEGKVGFEQVEQAFVNMTKEGGMFHGMMEEQAKSLFGMWSNLKDSFGSFLRSLGALLTDLFNLKGIISGVTTALGYLSSAMGSVTKWFQNLDPLSRKIVGTLVALVPIFLSIQAVVAVLVALGGLLVTKLVALGGALASVWVTMKSMSVWMVTNPFGLLIIAVAQLITLLLELKRVMSEGFSPSSNPLSPLFGMRLHSTPEGGASDPFTSIFESGAATHRARAAEEAASRGPSLAEIMDTRTSDIIRRSGDIAGPRTRKDFLSEEMASMRRADTGFATLRRSFEAMGGVAPDYLLPFRRSLERLETELDKTAASMRDAEHKAKSFVETLATETTTMGMSKHEAERYRLAIAGVSGETLRLVDAAIKMNEVAATQKKLAEDTKDFTNRLFEQSTTLGMTTLQAERYRLAARGADEATLMWADSMIASIEAFERRERLIEKGKSLTERFATPQERLARTQVELNELYNAGAITLEIYSRALGEAARETRNLANESRNALLYGSQEARNFLEGYRTMLRQRPLTPMAGGGIIPEARPMLAGGAGIGGMMGGTLSGDVVAVRLTEIRDELRGLRRGGAAIVPAALR